MIPTANPLFQRHFESQTFSALQNASSNSWPDTDPDTDTDLVKEMARVKCLGFFKFCLYKRKVLLIT